MSDEPKPLNIPLALVGVLLLGCPTLYWWLDVAHPLYDPANFKGEEIAFAKMWLLPAGSHCPAAHF
jgi:hypothetical protein